MLVGIVLPEGRVAYVQERVVIDQGFVDAAAHDYHLASGSAAADAGRDLGDLDGDQDTSELIPAGAYVTGDEVIGLVAP